ncbi:MAG: hypothetical protein K2N05_04115 [Muribaculaceae bacterium]|nr:hypothetical protein [Muribaculaceae bacterium]
MNTHHIKRAHWHDYQSRSIYFITINKRDNIPSFGRLEGDIMAEKGSPRYPTIKRTPLGNKIARMIYKLPEIIPSCRLYQYVVMPDHIHFLIFIQERTPLHLGMYISKFKHLLKEETGLSLFRAGFNDKVVGLKRNLNAIFEYIRENPYRLALRKANRAYFERCESIILAGRRYMAYGNLQILKNPFMEEIIIHRRYSDQDRRDLKEKWLRHAQSGGAVVSPFIAPGEKEIRKEIEALGGPVVLIVEKPLPPAPYKPSKHEFYQCAKGELVILAPYDEDLSGGSNRIPRSACKKMNALAEYLASRGKHSNP